MNDSAAARELRKREIAILDMMDSRNRIQRLQWLLSRELPDRETRRFFYKKLDEEMIKTGLKQLDK